VEIEWLILADAAQVVGNKLYVMGGGWDVLNVNAGFPADQRCAVAISVKVPWAETNQRHQFELEITDDDGKNTLAKMNGQIEVGRPPGIRPGQDQRIQLAADMFLRFASPGQQVIIARLDGQENRRVTFNVVGNILPPAKGPKPPGMA